MYLADLHLQRVVYVAEWAEDNLGRLIVRSYALGLNKRDKARPPPRDTNVAAKYRKRRDRTKALPSLARLGVTTV